MIRTKLGLLGLCAVVVGIMAFSASAAQAEPLAKWLILNSAGQVKTGAELPAIVEGQLENNTASLLSTVLGIKVQILCTNATLTGVKLEKEGSLTNGGKVKFTGCTVILNGKAAPECEVHSAGLPVGTVESLAGKGLLVLILAGVGATLIQPSEGETFARLNMGEECPIGENIPVNGKLVIEDCENLLTTHLVKHLIQEDAVHSDLWVLNKTAEHKATLDGSAFVFLGGAHVGLKWSGDPA